MKTKAVIRALGRAGVHPVRKKGGDFKYRMPDGRFLTVAAHQSETPSGVMGKIRKLLEAVNAPPLKGEQP